MTEGEWLEFANTHAIPDFLRDKASRRQLLLLACAQHQWTRLHSTDRRFRKAVEVVERYADDHATDEERATVIVALNRIKEEALPVHDFEKCASARHFADLVNSCRDDHPREVAGTSDPPEPSVLHRDGFRDLLSWTAQGPARLLHDIFGNPFRPVTLDSSCLTWNARTVPAMAERIYNERNWALLPVLADALEDAGCCSPDILTHCRGSGPHVRGCWVLDLLLGKE
jgi:hypothetical protein